MRMDSDSSLVQNDITYFYEVIEFMELTTIDIILLAIIGVGVVFGLMKGALKQLAAIVGLIVGLLVARALFGAVGEWLAPALGTSLTIAQILAFVLIWVAVPIGFSLVASLLTKVLDALSLGWLNRLLGSALGAIQYLLLISLAIHALEYIDAKDELISQTKKQESVLYYPIKEFSESFLPYVKNVTDKLIDK